MAELLDAEQQTIEGPGAVKWVAHTNCSVARSSTQAHGGTSSLAVTATAAGQMDVTLTTPYPATTAAVPHTASLWDRAAATGKFPTFYMRFSAGGNNFAGDFTSNPSETANTWVQMTVSGTSPAGADAVRIHVTWFNMSAGETIYIDDASIVSTPATLAPTRLRLPQAVQRAAVR